MPKPRRTTSYLQKRDGIWHFRFKVPSGIQSIAPTSEVRLSLRTTQFTLARERAASALPGIYALKRLNRMAKYLTPEIAQQILDKVFTQLVESLERSRDPWARPVESKLVANGGMFTPEPWPPTPSKADQYASHVGSLQNAIARGDGSKQEQAAIQYLQALNCEFEPSSPEFRSLALNLAKLEATKWQALHARELGDYQQEERFVEHYQRQGYTVLKHSPKDVPLLSAAWLEFYDEKTNGLPKPVWSEKTALGQQAMFDEFLEIVGDKSLIEIDRDAYRLYRTAISRLPKNRKKLYPDQSIEKLLNLELTDQQRPSSRTVAEKLVQIGSFLKWCKTDRQYLIDDPTEGISVKAESRSYAPFNMSDLEQLFYSREYLENKHKKAWQFWMPLIALYTGARQNELAQLRTRDVGEEDGIPFITITDIGEGQRVKTKAGIRKVPINSVLQNLGFVEYVNSLRAMNIERVFPDLEKGSKTWGQKVSAWFNATYKKKCGVEADSTGSRKVFHSFRHTAITKAMSCGVPLQHCQQVFGHEKSIMGETATYTHQFPVSSLTEVVECLDFGLKHPPFNN